MKNKSKKSKSKNDSNQDDESASSCETRRKIEDLHEQRRYQDELGYYEDSFELG